MKYYKAESYTIHLDSNALSQIELSPELEAYINHVEHLRKNSTEYQKSSIDLRKSLKKAAAKNKSGLRFSAHHTKKEQHT